MEIRAPSPTACPVCNSRQTAGCIRISDVPVYCNVLYNSREAALSAVKTDMELRLCGGCGHLFNAAFDPNRIDYGGEYENSLHYSIPFQEYAKSLAEHLVELHDLRGKTVIEIACGQGEFLQLLCALGGSKGIGFDPGYRTERKLAVSGIDLTFIREYYTDAFADLEADLICCRHALEHMYRPGAFLSMLRRVIGERATSVYFEVPNALFTLENLGIWDLIYEHCGYFSESSLRSVFERNGFRVERIEIGFGGQFLALHGVAAAKGQQVPTGDTGLDPMPLGERFAGDFEAKVERWRIRLAELRVSGRRVVLWGAGSKGVSFMNILRVGDEVDCLIDLNPHKHGRYIPGSAHQVRSPETLADNRPDVVIVMNPLYREEIRRDLFTMGIDAEILVDDTK